MMSKGTVFYVGGFILPDENAAAQRVVGIAKALREADYEVVFLNLSPYAGNSEWEEKNYFGFKCFEKKKGSSKTELIGYLTNVDYIKQFVEKAENVSAVIAYNYPAFALKKLMSFCKSRHIKCIGDVTEWYGSKGKAFFEKIIKEVDTSYRMRVLQKKLSGNIVISDFLEEYYSKTVNTVNIPPLVDKNDEKWDLSSSNHEGFRLIYAGTPSSEKERLDLIVEAVSELHKSYNIGLSIIGITRERFYKIYPDCTEEDEHLCVDFKGRIPHNEVLKQVSEADFSILIRDKNRVNTAGFPTKFVESISCGTPVLANESSCIAKYFNKGENGFLISVSTLKQDLEKCITKDEHPTVQDDIFDYRNYTEELKAFMEKCNA